MLEPGDFAPDFVLPSRTGVPTRFHGRAGGAPTILLFLRSGVSPGLETALAVFERAEAGAEDSPAIFVVVRNGALEEIPENPPVAYFVDAGEKVHAAYGAEEGPATVFLLDPNLRVIDARRLSAGDPSDALASVRLKLDAFSREPPRAVRMQAPVLLVPNVLDPALCRRLIEVWAAGGHAPTGVEQSGRERRAVDLVPQAKLREDHTVSDPELTRLLTQRIGRRLIREVAKAFSFKASRFEGFKIACYDSASGGYFRRHRDNLSPATAHRRFALTLNLNDGYRGGELRFPEYTHDLYRPDPGGALVFSGSLLHEVLDVTEGRRFALLSFLFSENDARLADAQ